MIWWWAVLVVIALGVIALVAAGRGRPMAAEYDDRPDAVVPETGPLGADDLRRVRFSLAFRGYRMSEVDALLDRLAAERDVERDAEPDAGRPDVGPDAEPDPHAQPATDLPSAPLAPREPPPPM